MSKKRYYIASAVAVIAIAALSVFWLAKSQKAEAPAGETIYYYGKDCPHCQEVDQFIKDNNIDQKIQFIKKEVQYNPSNAKELFDRDKECNITGDDVGAFPLVYSQGKCHLGTPDVINFFKNQEGI